MRCRALSMATAVMMSAAVAAPAAQAREAPETIVQDDAELLFRSDEQVEQSMRQLRAMGVDRVRLNAGWSSIAPVPESPVKPPQDLTDPNAYPRANWRRLDRAVMAANKAGLPVMIDIAFWAPRWATSGNPGGPPGRERYDVDPALLADFSAALVKRYSGSFVPERDTQASNLEAPDQQLLDGPLGALLGTGKPAPPPPPPAGQLGPLPRVSWWTIWNEPNHPGFLQPQYTRGQSGQLEPNTPHLYRRMIEKIAPMIKRMQPDSTVLVGGLASFGVKNPMAPTSGIPPLRFIRELACVDARLRPIAAPRCAGFKRVEGDGFAHHPYALHNRPDFKDPYNPDSARIGALDRLSSLLTKLVQRGRIDPKLANIYLTEFGYETNPPDPQQPYGLDQQAQFINWSEYLAWKNPQVRSWPQFLLRDLGVVDEDKAARGARPYADYQSGILFEDGRPKPAATSFELALFVDCVNAPAGRVRRSGRRGARFKVLPRAKRRRPGRRLVIWGHVRPGAAAHQVILEQRLDTAPRWQVASTARSAKARRRTSFTRKAFATSASGVFVRHAPVRRGVSYRLRLAGTGKSGLAVRPVSCNRKPELLPGNESEY